jgi:hypothetical protein
MIAQHFDEEPIQNYSVTLTPINNYGDTTVITFNVVGIDAMVVISSPDSLFNDVTLEAGYVTWGPAESNHPVNIVISAWGESITYIGITMVDEQEGSFPAWLIMVLAGALALSLFVNCKTLCCTTSSKTPAPTDSADPINTEPLLA